MIQNFKYKDEYNHPIQNSLNVTDNCNLACKYCFVNQAPHYTTLDIAKKSIDYTANNYYWHKKNNTNIYQHFKKICFLFFGGEPMLCYNDIIKPTVLYALNKYPDIFSFTITTNGTLLTEESLLFFYEHNFSNIMLSIDGDKDSQDYNRPYHNGTSSFDIIQEKIPMILKYFPNTSFRSTITPYTVKNLFNNYLFAEKNNFSQIVFMPELRHNWDSKDLNIFSYELQKIFNYRLNQYRNNCMPIQSKQINYALEDILNHDFKIMTNNNNDDFININLDKWICRCGTGVESCAIGFDGSIYTCIERPSRDYKEQGFYLGTLKNGIDKNMHIQILKKIIKDYNKIFSAFKSCSDDCISYQRCLFTHCISNSIDNFNNTNTIPLSLCYVNLEILKNCICNMQILFKENNLLFEHYLLQNTNTYKQIYYIKNMAKGDKLN